MSTRTRYGASHPEHVKSDLWEKCIREGWNGYAFQQHLGIKRKIACQDFSHSSYRDADPGPFWSWECFGRTSTPLPNGRVIHIAGEHEDSYDPDFCIYNDVVVEYPDGRWEFYLYPKDVFPPTDFHTATLIGHEILLIGSVGYRDLRRVGETQVLKLDTRTLRIAQVATSGDGPGWISRHTIQQVGETAVLVIGGKVQTENDYVTNSGLFELDLATMTWRRMRHGDTTVFPIPDETYRAYKNPRFGTTNPERSDNHFWLEMARHQWPPSRARLHYDDVASAREEEDLLADGPSPAFGTREFAAWSARISARIERQKLARTIDDVVWTAVREDSLKVALPDGRRLLIGGEVPYYGDEEADAWAYNDVVVSNPDGTIEILTYPQEVFPQLASSVGAIHGTGIYIFGILDGHRHPSRRRGVAVFRLDANSYEITELQAAAPVAHPNIYAGGEVRDGSRIIFPLVRDHEYDPELGIAFDLDTLTWSAAFEHRHPRSGD